MTAEGQSQSDALAIVHDFINAGLFGDPTDRQVAEMDQLLRESDDARQLYADLLDLSVSLPRVLATVLPEESIRTTATALGVPGSEFQSLDMPQSAIPPFASLQESEIPGQARHAAVDSSPFIIRPVSNVPDPLATAHPIINYFSSGWPLAYLSSTVICAIGILILASIPVSHPTQFPGSLAATQPVGQNGAETNANADTESPKPTSSSSKFPPMVGRITGMVDCRWKKKALGVRDWELGKDRKGTNQKYLVAIGDRYALSSGLMEITYDTGAKVVLQGPCTYEAESKVGGFLAVGKLTARVEKRGERRGESGERAANHDSSLSTLHSPLFTIKTPTATVTDLGTEFGVEVDTRGRLNVHVFQGLVECSVPAADGVPAQTLRLTKDAAVRIAPGGAAIERCPANREQFAQLKMPQRRPLSLAGFYPFDGDAKDQSGGGNHVGPEGIHGVTFVHGVEGQAARFEPAAGSFIDLPIDASPAAMPRLTWGAWVRPRTIGPKPMELLSTDIVGYGRMLAIDDRVGMGEGTPDTFRFSAFLGNLGTDQGVFPSTGPLPQAGVWTFVAVVHDDSAHLVKLYVEDKSLYNGLGGLIMDRTIGLQFGPCHSFVRVGRHAASALYGDTFEGDPFDGEIDNIFLFREALDMNELELICKHRATAILALAKGEPLPEEGGVKKEP